MNFKNKISKEFSVYVCDPNRIIFNLHEIYLTNAEFMNHLGENLAAKGKIDQATAVTRYAVERDPFFLMAHLKLGKLYFTNVKSGRAFPSSRPNPTVPSSRMLNPR
jgi:hypothetical protein